MSGPVAAASVRLPAELHLLKQQALNELYVTTRSLHQEKSRHDAVLRETSTETQVLCYKLQRNMERLHTAAVDLRSRWLTISQQIHDATHHPTHGVAWKQLMEVQQKLLDMQHQLKREEFAARLVPLGNEIVDFERNYRELNEEDLLRKWAEYVELLHAHLDTLVARKGKQSSASDHGQWISILNRILRTHIVHSKELFRTFLEPNSTNALLIVRMVSAFNSLQALLPHATHANPLDSNPSMFLLDVDDADLRMKSLLQSVHSYGLQYVCFVQHQRIVDVVENRAVSFQPDIFFADLLHRIEGWLDLFVDVRHDSLWNDPHKSPAAHVSSLLDTTGSKSGPYLHGSVLFDRIAVDESSRLHMASVFVDATVEDVSESLRRLVSANRGDAHFDFVYWVINEVVTFDAALRDVLGEKQVVRSGLPLVQQSVLVDAGIMEAWRNRDAANIRAEFSSLKSDSALLLASLFELFQRYEMLPIETQVEMHRVTTADIVEKFARAHRLDSKALDAGLKALSSVDMLWTCAVSLDSMASKTSQQLHSLFIDLSSSLAQQAEETYRRIVRQLVWAKLNPQSRNLDIKQFTAALIQLDVAPVRITDAVFPAESVMREEVLLSVEEIALDVLRYEWEKASITAAGRSNYGDVMRAFVDRMCELSQRILGLSGPAATVSHAFPRIASFAKERNVSLATNT
jgi:hypothetical protein